MADESTDIRTTTAAASNQLAWDDLNTRLSGYYQRAAWVGIDAAVAAARRLTNYQQSGLELDDETLIEDTRAHAMAHYLCEECE